MNGPSLPKLADLGPTLTIISRTQRWLAIALPLLFVAAYFIFAHWRWWPLAILCVAGYTFVSYGSTSHDLLHGNLGLSRRSNILLLSLIELLGLRSGHAYRASHLHHHKSFPDRDDVKRPRRTDRWRGHCWPGRYISHESGGGPFVTRATTENGFLWSWPFASSLSLAQSRPHR